MTEKGCSLLRVESVAPHSAAADARVVPGMVLQALDGRGAESLSVRDVQQRLLEATPAKPCHLSLVPEREATCHTGGG